MKRYFFFVLTIFCISFVACSDDKEEMMKDMEEVCSGKTEAISIIVDGVPSTNIKGSAVFSSDRISVDISGESSNNSTVFFRCPKKEGLYDLGFNANQTVTAFVPDGVVNIILTSGCFEIVSIDTAAVVMRFNVNEDETKINGEISLEVE